jgi:hypothetical protein
VQPPKSSGKKKKQSKFKYDDVFPNISRNLEEALTTISDLKNKLDRRDALISSLRREAALNLLQGIDPSRADLQTQVFERLKKDELKINELQGTVSNLQLFCEAQTRELASARKTHLMETNKYKNSINTLENANFQLQEKLKATIHEVKQKTTFLSGKEAIAEQLHVVIRERDEKYLRLEEKFASIMVLH